MTSSPALSRWSAALLLLCSAAITSWTVFRVHPMETAIYSDMFEYLKRAAQIRRGVFEPTHFLQPLGYPLWVAFWRGVAGNAWWLLKASHVALVVASVFLGWRIARHLLPAPWDLLVLALLAFQIQWWMLAAFALAETLFTFFVTVLAWAAIRWSETDRMRYAALTGLVFGVGFAVKGQAVFFPVFLALWCALRVRRDPCLLRPVATRFGVFMLAAGVVAVVHGSLAYAHYGRFKLGADSGGINFVEGKCPSKDNFDSAGNRYHSPLFYELGEMTQKKWDAPFTDQAYYWREGLKCVRDDPTVLITSFRYIYYLFAGNSLWPVEARRQHLPEQLYEAWFAWVVLPLAMAGLVVALRRPERPIALAAYLYLSLFAVVWLFKSELRFRVPFDAITMILAATGALVTWRWLASLHAHRHAITGAGSQGVSTTTGTPSRTRTPGTQDRREGAAPRSLLACSRSS
jgi:hypothetical protein